MTTSTLAAKTDATTPAAGRPTYTWSKTGRQYRDERGRAVSRVKVRGAMDAYVDSITATMRRDTEALVAGSMTIDRWHELMEINLKEAHVSSGAIAAGGWKQARPADWALVGRRLKFRYGKLRQFARELEDGLPLDGSVVARAEMYGRGATGTYEAVLRQGDIAAGLDLERRITHSRGPCDRCVSHASRGWQPAGVLPDIGADCDCLDNCQCTFERKRSKPAPKPAKPKPVKAPKPAKPAPPPIGQIVDPRARIEAARREQRAANEAASASNPQYDFLRRRFPDLIPPGKIEDRIAAYRVGDEKVKAVLDVGKRSGEQDSVLQAERNAHNRTLTDLMDRQEKLIAPYASKGKPIPDKVASQVYDIQNQIDATTLKRDAVKVQQQRLRRDQIRDAHALLAVTDRAEFHGDPADAEMKRARGLDPLNSAGRARADEAILWLRTHVASGEVSTVVRKLGQASGQRAYHSGDRTHIALDPASGLPTIIHEYGHAIEADFKTGPQTVSIRSMEFLKHRVKDEPLTKLRDKFGERFDADEVGRSDKFGDAFGGDGSSSSYYVGKQYARGDSTEILAMGLQKMYEDPVGFAKADPEYFKFVCGVLDNSLR